MNIINNINSYLQLTISTTQHNIEQTRQKSSPYLSNASKKLAKTPTWKKVVIVGLALSAFLSPSLTVSPSKSHIFTPLLPDLPSANTTLPCAIVSTQLNQTVLTSPALFYSELDESFICPKMEIPTNATTSPALASPSKETTCPKMEVPTNSTSIPVLPSAPIPIEVTCPALNLTCPAVESLAQATTSPALPLPFSNMTLPLVDRLLPFEEIKNRSFTSTKNITSIDYAAIAAATQQHLVDFWEGAQPKLRWTGQTLWRTADYAVSTPLNVAKWVFVDDGSYLRKKIKRIAQAAIVYKVQQYAEAHPDWILNRDIRETHQRIKDLLLSGMIRITADTQAAPALFEALKTYLSTQQVVYVDDVFANPPAGNLMTTAISKLLLTFSQKSVALLTAINRYNGRP